MRLQLSLEFMVVFSFVLIVFLFIFTIIVNNRALAINQQVFSQMQIEAQSVGIQLDQAAQFGNGYSVQFPLTSTLGLSAYNLSITKGGIVIVSSTIGKQKLQATFYSMARNIQSSSSFLSGNAYSIPITNGSLSIQNSFGNICIDYVCPQTPGQAMHISLTAQNVHVANLNGFTGKQGAAGYIYAPIGSGFLNANSATWSAWVYLNSTTNGVIFGIANALPPNGNTGNYEDMLLGASGLTLYMNVNSSLSNTTLTYTLAGPGWYNLVYIYSPGGPTLYVNGHAVTFICPSGCTPAATSATQFYWTTYIPGTSARPSAVSPIFNGRIANVQIYTSALSSSQITTLYNEGIVGLPVANGAAINPVGWWPLNGDTNDYSGNKNKATNVGFLIFTVVSQLQAHVTDQYGNPVANDLVGFETTLGNFTAGRDGSSFTNYTNSNGFASAFLSQGLNNGYAFVKAYAYNGNLSVQSNVVDWWPIGLGQTGVAYDFGSGKNTGYLSDNALGQTLPYNVVWSGPSSSFQFDGQSAYIQVPTSTLQFPVGSISMWFKTTDPSGVLYSMQNAQYPSIPSNFIPVIYIENGRLYTQYGQAGSCSQTITSSNVSDGFWHNVVVVYNSGTTSTYLDGALVASAVTGRNQYDMIYQYMGVGYGNACMNLNGYTYFQGNLANVQIYSSALAQNSVEQIYVEGPASTPVLTSGVVAWYPLNGDAKDYSGNLKNAVTYGNLQPVSIAQNPTYSSNLSSIAVAKFDGSSSYANVGNAATLNPSTMSVNMWINGNTFSDSAYHDMLSKFTGSNGWYFAVNTPKNSGTCSSNGQVYVYTLASSRVVCSTTALLPNVWYDVTFTNDGSNTLIYINGVLDGSGSQSIIGSSSPTSNLIIGGGIISGTSYVFNGLISNVQMYSTVLKQSQIEQLYQEGMDGFPISGASLAGWWPLEGSAADSSRNGNTANQVVNVIYMQQTAFRPNLIEALNGYGVNIHSVQNVLPGIAATASGLPSGGNAQSFFAWIYYTGPSIPYSGGTPTTYTISSHGGGCGVNGDLATLFGIYNGLLAFGGCSMSTAVSSLSVQPYAWHFVGYTYSFNSLSLTMYLDSSSNTVTLSRAVSDGVSDSRIGAPEFGIGSSKTFNSFNGTIADAQYYKSVLNSSQITQLYQGGVPPSASVTIPLSWEP